MTKTKIAKDDSKVLIKRQKEWRAFRHAYLYTQRQLAAKLDCGVRTVQAVEAATYSPLASLQRRFAALKARHETPKNQSWVV